MGQIKLLTLIVLIVLYILPATAIPAGESYLIAEIPLCFEDALVKVRGKEKLQEGEYSFEGCTFKDSLWHCPCKRERDTQIYLLTNHKTRNEYDIVLEYYIKPQKNHNNRRTLNFNNIQITEGEKQSVSFNLPDINIGSGVMFLFIFIVVGGGLGYGVYRFICKIFDDNKIESSKTQQQDLQRLEIVSDDDVRKLLHNLEEGGK